MSTTISQHSRPKILHNNKRTIWGTIPKSQSHAHCHGLGCEMEVCPMFLHQLINSQVAGRWDVMEGALKEEELARRWPHLSCENPVCWRYVLWGWVLWLTWSDHIHNTAYCLSFICFMNCPLKVFKRILLLLSSFKYFPSHCWSI